ncbi:LysR substrate-binding domain-containing protein [Aquabacter cavernae]|uniref:LysR substrate-binding domain-containing protein n=1 Tax=Aquabacter cavernae TaxID=2496029 RepID=UPI0013DFCBB8|nr:LysR substrate-binding domain-containing protein [Aquabacter cavernae]
MINLNDYYYFAHVVDSNGITAASRSLNLPKSTLSRRITDLETRLGVRLIHRSSRTFLVTELGSEFYRHARNMLEEAQAAESAVRNRLAKPSGTLKVACSPLAAALCLGPALPGFLAGHPDVRIEQRMLARLDETGARAADVYVVAHDGPLEDSSMIRRRLTVEPRHLFAAPELADDLKSAAHLARHNLFILAETPARPVLVDSTDRSELKLDAEPRLVSSDSGAILSAIRAGAGIGLLPASCCARAVTEGDMVRVLPRWSGTPLEVSALLPSSRGVLPSVRALLDLMGGRRPGAAQAGPSTPKPALHMAVEGCA